MAFSAHHAVMANPPSSIREDALTKARFEIAELQNLLEERDVEIDYLKRQLGQTSSADEHAKLHIAWRLTATETTLLLALYRRKSVLPKATLLSALYPNPADEAEIKIVDVYVCKIRRKVGGAVHAFIRTIWGVGYQLTDYGRACVAAALGKELPASALALIDAGESARLIMGPTPSKLRDGTQQQKVIGHVLETGEQNARAIADGAKVRRTSVYSALSTACRQGYLEMVPGRRGKNYRATEKARIRFAANVGNGG